MKKSTVIALIAAYKNIAKLCDKNPVLDEDKISHAVGQPILDAIRETFDMPEDAKDGSYTNDWFYELMHSKKRPRQLFIIICKNMAEIRRQRENYRVKGRKYQEPEGH